MKKFYLAVCAAILLMALASSTEATPITLSGGQSVIYSFDFSDAQNEPPYDNFISVHPIIIHTADGRIKFNFFTDLNNPGGTQIDDMVWWCAWAANTGLPRYATSFKQHSGDLDPPVYESKLFGSFEVISGTAQLDSFSLTMYKATPSLEGQFVAFVPIPGTLLLFGTGLLGLAACRRWRMQG